jgi:hypothetical protein
VFFGVKRAVWCYGGVMLCCVVFCGVVRCFGGELKPKGVIEVLQECCKSVTGVLQVCQMGVTEVYCRHTKRWDLMPFKCFEC